MTSAFARALNRIGHDGRFTYREMAAVAECSDRHLYNVADERNPASLNVEKAEKLSRWLSEQGETRLAEAFFGSSHALVRRAHGNADGCCKDEIVAAVKALAGIDTAHTGLARADMDGCIAQLRDALADLEAERDRLPA